MELRNYIAEKRVLIEESLKKYIYNEIDAPVVREAMAYSLFAGGKRLRPILAIMACELFNGDVKKLMPFACSLEFIHTYSLIHDDLPAMNNDDYRRGKLTNHRVFGEGFAVLAGDALLNKAYEILLETISNDNRPEFIMAAQEISRAAGVKGMIGGQAMDLYYENKNISHEELKNIHDKKTGALLKASLTVGALIANAPKKDMETINEYGNLIGRAFQIADDILDIKGNKERLGKDTGKDEKKSTYVKYFGILESEKIAKETVDEAKKIISVYGDKGILFKNLADYIICRDI
ncbi:MAG: polyprenyl synthetase family protein [Clostridiales bacterium]|nr:polyprenyl synthetase family protein [Clostridiales bacterium]